MLLVSRDFNCIIMGYILDNTSFVTQKLCHLLFILSPGLRKLQLHRNLFRFIEIFFVFKTLLYHHETANLNLYKTTTMRSKRRI